MTIQSLQDVDLDRLRKVKNGMPWDRGNGKTIERLIRLLSRNRKDNYNKHYMFVTETRDHALYCLDQMEWWIIETNQYNTTNNKLVISQPREPKTKLQRFYEILGRRYNEPDNLIIMSFVSAGGYKQEMRGTKFSEIFFDVSDEGYRNNFKSLHNIMKLSPNLYE